MFQSHFDQATGKKKVEKGHPEAVSSITLYTFKEIFDPVYESLQTTYTGKHCDRGYETRIAQGLDSEMQHKMRELVFEQRRLRITTSAAQNVHELLCKRRLLFRLLSHLLGSGRALHWSRSGGRQVLLAVLYCHGAFGGHGFAA